MNTYLEHFHRMVMSGLIQGLKTPQEWIVSYSRGLGEPQERLSEIKIFCTNAAKEMCKADTLLTRGPSKKEVTEWFKKVYGDKVQGVSEEIPDGD